jgi:hypothetical protein
VQATFMILVVLLGTLILSVVAGAIYQTIGIWRDRRRFPPSGGLVRVNERLMHIHVTGEGTPTVVFESGMGASSLSWTLVQPQVARFTRAVSYDRAGHGWSDAAREPRTARQIAQELHRLQGHSRSCRCYRFTKMPLVKLLKRILSGPIVSLLSCPQLRRFKLTL